MQHRIYDQYILWKLEIINEHTMYIFLVYDPKHDTTQNDAWAYEMYGLGTLHEDLDISKKFTKQSCLDLKHEQKSRACKTPKTCQILDSIHVTKA